MGDLDLRNRRIAFCWLLVREGRRRHHLHPPAGAILDVRVVCPCALAVVPVVLCRGRRCLDVLRRRRLDHHGWRDIVPVRCAPPTGSPPSEAAPDEDPRAPVPPLASAVEVPGPPRAPRVPRTTLPRISRRPPTVHPRTSRMPPASPRRPPSPRPPAASARIPESATSTPTAMIAQAICFMFMTHLPIPCLGGVLDSVRFLRPRRWQQVTRFSALRPTGPNSTHWAASLGLSSLLAATSFGPGRFRIFGSSGGAAHCLAGLRWGRCRRPGSIV